MSDETKKRFGLPRKSDEPEPWWRYAEPYDANGMDGDLAYKGLLKRAVHHPDEVLWTWASAGCFEGTWEELMVGLWPEDYDPIKYNFRGEPNANNGDWAEDPRPRSEIIGSHPNGSIRIRQTYDKDPCQANVLLDTSDEALYWKVRRWTENHFTPGSQMGVVRCLSRPKPTSPFSLVTLGRFEDTYEPENYDPQVIEQFDRLIEDLNSPNPRGRMAILHGEPGTGKTYLLKAITQACPNALVIFVPNTLVADLGNPELIEIFTEYRTNPSQRIILLAEDADVIFRKRDKDNTNAISSALNLTDGIFGELLRVYIVGTTNVDVCEIDPAINRPGRLSEEISVGPLSPKQTSKVYRRLKENPKARIPDALKKGATLAEIYSKAGVYKKTKARPASGATDRLHVSKAAFDIAMAKRRQRRTS